MQLSRIYAARCEVRALAYVAVRAIVGAIQSVPDGMRRRLIRGIAALAWIIDRRHRERTVEHLRLAYGDTREETARRVFDHIGRHVADILRAMRGGVPGIMIENEHILREAHARGRGVVLVSAHLGSFLLLGLVAKRLGVPAVVMLKSQRNERLLCWAREVIRRDFGGSVVLKPDARREIPPLLRGGSIVLLFADQHPNAGGVPARFFGRPIEAAAGPAIFSRRYGAPLVVCTIIAQADGSHVARFDGPISSEEPIAAVSQRWIDILEARIREHPEQWMWMHRRWR